MYTERVISTIVELLDRMFIFKSEYWKDVILKRDKETIKYHFCISIDEANSKMNFNEDKKPTVDKVYDEVWDRDDKDGTDFVFVLPLE